ncbi:MAG: dihydroorotate dehydrogenase [Spirochaetales bacterium]|nr:dihydroorotate dehydrogenase [Spirochaetales bacterium]
MDLSIYIGGKKLVNPVGVASGTFGYGSEYEKLVDFTGLGALYTKTVTLKSRSGNKCPRIIETPSGMLNSIGLANVGVDRFISEKLPLLEQAGCALIPNIAGFTEYEYAAILKRLEASHLPWGYEINISCPNVSHGGFTFGTNPAMVEHLTAKLRRITEKPLIIKLTPNVTDIRGIAQAAENGGADAVSCINTLVGMVIDTKTKKPVLGNITGGLSGPAIRPVGVASVYRVKRAVTIPVIGLGGIMTADDAIQYFLAGASAIQIGTGNFVDPGIPQKVLAGIKDYCEHEGMKTIGDFHQFIE